MTTPEAVQATDLVELTGRYFDLEPEIVQDPYPLFHRLQAEAPVLIFRSMATLTRYADIESVIRDMETYVSRPVGASRVEAAAARLDPHRAALLRENVAFMGQWLSVSDPPAHTRIRGLAHRAFTPRHVAELRQQVQRITGELLDRAAERGRVELIDEFAFQLPLFVIGAMLGAPAEDRRLVRRLSNALADFIGAEYRGIEEANQAIKEFRSYLHDLYEKRRASPGPDLLTAFMEAEADGQRLTRDELDATMVQLLFAGHETTTNLIANGLHALLTHPDQLARLRAEPQLIGNAVEEFLRWNTSSQVLHRSASRDSEIAGVGIPRGMTLRLFLGAANRDPERYEEPDRFDMTRADLKHLGFGIGPHYCLGQALARMETAIAVGTILARFPVIELEGPAGWRPNLQLRGLEALPLRLRAA
jgi:cytochrome P450